MAHFILQRLAHSAATALIVAMLAFGLARLAGDPVPLLMPSTATNEDIEFFRRQLGLDKPIPQQFVTFIGNAVRGDFGSSFRYSVPAFDLVMSRVPATALLAFSALFLAAAIGIPLGILAALRHGSISDQAIRWAATVGQAVPNFWFGLMLILVFAVSLRWLPTSGYGTGAQLIMPTVTLGLTTAAYITRITRSSMMEVMQADFIKLQRLTGLPQRLIIWKHALRNASIPVVTLTALQLGALLGGSVVTEVIFGWPGLGHLTVSAIMFRDFPVIQASVIVIAGFFLVVNFLTDISYRLLDARVRL
ncbi:MAG TPA: ABC transporter permease [Xanthobacteraceae bacterium]|nr:ABC transporter permease [Xanthobacteraceae bacterium]